MPAMGNLALKNNAGTAVVGTALTPSAGDTVPAKWRIESAVAPAFRPILSLSTRDSGDGKSRRAVIKLSMPFTATNSTLGLPVVVDRELFSADIVVGNQIPSTSSDDFVAYVSSFLADPLVVASLKAMIAPT